MQEISTLSDLMKKNHSSDTPPVSLDDILEESQTLAWITANGKTILLAVFGVFLLAIIAYKMAFAGAEKNEYNFITAENDYQLFLSKGQPESLQRLDALMTAYPELHAKYDALIAQNLISQGKIEEALPYAIPSLKSTNQENAPFYSAYAQTSLLIGEKKFEESLTKALNLKHLIEKEAPAFSGSLLYGVNLIRIGMLQNQLGLLKDETELWKEWKKYAALNHSSQEFNGLLHSFLEGKVSLDTYIEARQKELEKS